MKRGTFLRCVAFALLVASLVVAWIGAEPSDTPRARARSFSERLLGPFAELAAQVQWVRVDDALRAGRFDRAYARAAHALELAPGDARGWCMLARHFVFDRASLAANRDPRARAQWVSAGLALLEEGERRSRDPGYVAYQTGIVYLSFALADDLERAWPGTREEARASAQAAFERAAQAGYDLDGPMPHAHEH